MKKLLSITLALIMCIGALSAGMFAASAVEENLLAGASYSYDVGEFFDVYTDYSMNLLTDGEYRGDGTNQWDDIYAVAGTTVELVGTNTDNVIVFSLENEIFLEYLYFRGFRRVLSGNRYTNIAAIEVSSNGVDYTSTTYTETATAIDGAPLFVQYIGDTGTAQYYDVKTTFSSTLSHVKYIKVTINTYSSAGRKYICQLDEVEAYGSKTSPYTEKAELALTPSKSNVDIGETFTVNVMFNKITTPNGIVASDLPLIYDTARLELVGVAGIFPSTWGGTGTLVPPSSATAKPYWLRGLCNADDLAVNSAYNVTKDGALGYTLTFKALASGTANISIENDIENNIYLFVVNGANFTNYGVKGATTSVTVSGDVVAYVLGDVNCDGEVDNLDAAIVLRYDAGIMDFTDDQFKRGDYNSDGEVNNVDAAMILRYDAGL